MWPVGVLGILVFGLFFVAPAPVSAEITVDYGGATYTVDDKGNFTGDNGLSGYIDLSTGNFSVDGGGGGGGNIADLTGATVSTEVNGGSVSVTIDDHSYDYQAEMFRAGTQYVSAVTSGGDTQVAIDRANAALQKESGGTQQVITVRPNSDGSISYGCVNNQNTTISISTSSTFLPVTNGNGGGGPPGSGGVNDANNNTNEATTRGATGDSRIRGNAGDGNVNGNQGTGGNNNNNRNNNPAPVCNQNGVCESGENENNCPADCGDLPVTIGSVGFTALPGTVTVNKAVTLSWFAQGATACSIVGKKASNGQQFYSFSGGSSGSTMSPKLTEDTDFTLSCSNQRNGADSKTIRVKVINPLFQEI